MATRNEEKNLDENLQIHSCLYTCSTSLDLCKRSHSASSRNSFCIDVLVTLEMSKVLILSEMSCWETNPYIWGFC